MNEAKAQKILEIIKKKLLSEKIPDDATGKLIVNLASGGVSGDATLEIKV